MLSKNVGGSDRLLRIAAGAVLLGLFFISPDAPLRWFALVGIVPLATGIFSRCPLYTITGTNTAKLEQA